MGIDTPRSARWLPFVLLTIIVCLGALSRIVWLDYPNIKPIAALLLFGGYFLANWRWSAIAVVLLMGISDGFLGGSPWPIAAAVYVSLFLAGLLGQGLVGWVKPPDRGLRATGQRTIGFLAASLIMASTFFLLTNLVTWLCWYEMSWSGLGACYVAAIPFYRATLTGDLMFTMGLLGVYELVLACQPVAQAWRIQRASTSD